MSHFGKNNFGESPGFDAVTIWFTESPVAADQHFEYFLLQNLSKSEQIAIFTLKAVI